MSEQILLSTEDLKKTLEVVNQTIDATYSFLISQVQTDVSNMELREEEEYDDFKENLTKLFEVKFILSSKQ